MNSKCPLRFIDVFAGCGGLSLGLAEAGCKGVFAIERSPLAFETLRYNLIDGTRHQFDWPGWLPKQAMTCEELLECYQAQLEEMRGTIDIAVGGPPCQGFSTAGRRDPADPRNKMAEQYLSVIDLVQPSYIVIENVAGFNLRFEKHAGIDLHNQECSYAEYVSDILGRDYNVYRGLLNCADFGVPQMRYRYLILCSRKDQPLAEENLFTMLQGQRAQFRKAKGLEPEGYITTKQAISDLETAGRQKIPNLDSGMQGFEEIAYNPRGAKTAFQKLMRRGAGDNAPDSLRLPNHKHGTILYFQEAQFLCRPGHSMSRSQREQLGTKKHSITVLSAKHPAPTVTTLPDDIIHYCEPRILTARECARLQSFPDWFSFRGKYTTGGKSRKQECPRYTQIGNAVPPLLGEAIARGIIRQMKLGCKASLTTPLLSESGSAPEKGFLSEAA